MPDGNFPEVEFPDMEFPFMPGENPDYPLPTPSLPSMPPSGGGNGGRPNRPNRPNRPGESNRPNRPGGFPGGQPPVDRGVSDPGLPGEYAGRLTTVPLIVRSGF